MKRRIYQLSVFRIRNRHRLYTETRNPFLRPLSIGPKSNIRKFYPSLESIRSAQSL